MYVHEKIRPANWKCAENESPKCLHNRWLCRIPLIGRRVHEVLKGPGLFPVSIQCSMCISSDINIFAASSQGYIYGDSPDSCSMKERQYSNELVANIIETIPGAESFWTLVE